MSKSVANRSGKGSSENSVPKTDFKKLWFSDFYTDPNNVNNFFRLQVTNINGKPFVGITKMFFNEQTQQNIFTNKNLFMPAKAWTELKFQIGNVDRVLNETLTSLSMYIYYKNFNRVY
jgi:hypothetical protein